MWGTWLVAETPNDQIQSEFVVMLQMFARTMDIILNGDDPKPKMGFFIAVYPHEGHEVGGEARFNYISNSKREDIVILLQEMTVKFKGQADVVGHA